MNKDELKKLRTLGAISVLINVILIGAIIYVFITLKNVSAEIINLEKESISLSEQDENFREIENLIDETRGARAELDGYFVKNQEETIKLSDVGSFSAK